MATTYAYLVDPNKQYMTKSGTINVNGTLRVYDAATDDIVITYKDFNGTENEASITLDNNGRAIVIADSSRAYRLEVYDRYGSLQWTVSPLWCLAAGGGVNISRTEIISTDGSIDIDKVTVGSTTTFDIGLAPNDSDEFLEWITCSEEDCGSTWYPVYQSGTMETEAGQGVKVHGGHLYHFTNSFTVDPNGSGINYDTFRVTMYCGDEIVDVRDFDIDSSLNDAVLCEFSRDVVPTEDTHVYFKLTIPSTCEVSAEVQCHRIYSGINAVPDTCATKQWVQETFDYNLAEKISYSALEYNGSGYISGISGSAIAGGLDSATVSAIASSYAESAISSISGWSGDFSSISSKIDWSSSGMFQPSGNYQTAGDYAYNSAVSSKVEQSAFTQCCDEVHSAIDGKLDRSASSEFQPSGNYASASDLSAYVPFSGIEGEGGRVTGISGSAIKGHEYTGLNPVTVDNTADTISVEHRTLCVDSTMTAYTTGDSAVIGVNVAGLDISSKMDASASSLFYSTSNPSGFIDGASASAIASAYAESAASSKQDTLSFSYDDDKISAINGSALAGQGGGGLVTAIGTSESGITSINDSGLVDTAALHSADYSSLYVQEPLYISASGDSSYIGISGGDGDYLTAKVGSGQATFTTAFQDGMEKRPTLMMEAQRSAGSKMYPRMMVTDWNDTTGDTHSGALLSNAFEFYICPQSARGEVAPSGVVQSRLDASRLQFNVDDAVSSFTRSSEFTRSGMKLGLSGNSASWVAISGNGSSGGFVTLDDGSGVSGRIVASSIPYWNDKLDGSASSSFYTTANESGYVDSAYVESQVSSKQDTLTFDWDADSAISSINGSALAGQGGGGASITAVSYDTATQQSSIVTATGFGIVGSATNYPRISSVQLTDGQTRYIEANTLAPGAAQTASGSISYTLLFSPRSSMWTTATVATGIFSPLQYGTGAGLFMNNNNFKGYIKGNEWFVSNIACGYARGEVHQNRGARVIVEHTGGAGATLVAYRRDANVTLNSTAYGTAKMAVANSQAYVQVQRGNSDSKYNSAKLDTDYLKFYNGMTTGYIDPEDTASGTAYMPAETEYMYISSIPYWNGKLDASASSSFLTAQEQASWSETASASPSYIVDKPDLVDIVAGPGIVVDNPDGNTLRVSTEADAETVLWEGTAASVDTAKSGLTLTESPFNFEYVEVHWVPWAYNDAGSYKQEAVARVHLTSSFPRIGLINEWTDESNAAMFLFSVNGYFTSAKFYTTHVKWFQIGSWTVNNTGTGQFITRIVGIHRIANN